MSIAKQILLSYCSPGRNSVRMGGMDSDFGESDIRMSRKGRGAKSERARQYNLNRQRKDRGIVRSSKAKKGLKLANDYSFLVNSKRRAEVEKAHGIKPKTGPVEGYEERVKADEAAHEKRAAESPQALRERANRLLRQGKRSSEEKEAQRKGNEAVRERNKARERRNAAQIVGRGGKTGQTVTAQPEEGTSAAELERRREKLREHHEGREASLSVKSRGKKSMRCSTKERRPRKGLVAAYMDVQHKARSKDIARLREQNKDRKFKEIK